MARRQVTQYFDDLDDSPLSEDEVKVIRFSFEGVDYVLDLSEDNARAFQEALAPFLAVARKESRDMRKKVNPAKIRSWARGKGLEVADRGKIPHEIIQAYHDAHA